MNDIKTIIDYLNNKYNQHSVWTEGIRLPKIEQYDNTTIISYWECGCIVVIGRMSYFIEQDDLYWFQSEYDLCFDASLLKSFGDAVIRLSNYLKENGVPYYYEGTNNICGYELK